MGRRRTSFSTLQYRKIVVPIKEVSFSFGIQITQRAKFKILFVSASKEIMQKMAAKGGHIDFMFLGPPLPGRWIRCCALIMTVELLSKQLIDLSPVVTSQK